MIRQKATVWAVSIASVFIIGFLTATFIYTEKNEQAGEGEITEQFLLQLEESYKEEREKKQEILQLSDVRFNKVSFIAFADDRIQSLLGENKTMSREEMEAEFEEVIEGITLPSEMLTELISNPLINDEEASIAFMAEYRNKVNDLIIVYNNVLIEDNAKKYELNN